ncbi:MAG: sensor histidine kinase [Betaproteobacteria bacterium]|nr:sensor histidine kinase [Betaproteobacteria bacterium]
MASINQPQRTPDRLPDFLNIGVWLRTVLLVTAMSLAATVLVTRNWTEIPEEFSIVSLHVQPVAVLTLAVLALFARPLGRLPYRAGLLAVLVVTQLAALAFGDFMERAFSVDAGTADRQIFFALATGSAVLFYFHLRGRALSPALTEARLQALQARIRPHFLFNSLNAVLSLIRTQPRRAEAALEDMADLFRVLMADNRDLTPLEQEVSLCRQYLDIEQLRLGERLQVEWHVDRMPRDALVPPLILQPLLENAVYHGVEPSTAPATITINIFQSRGDVHVVLKNPVTVKGGHQSGNRMALENIRERLALHFDEEGRLEARMQEGEYQVRIRIPYRREGDS